MDGYSELVKRISDQGLKPNPRVVGEFVRAKEDKDKLKFLSPNNWVFHDQVVESVLSGDYKRIKPVCAEFVPTLNCSNRCGICAYKLPKILEGCWQRNLFSDPSCQMTPETAGDFLKRLFDYGIKGIIFTGGGEPFLFPGLENLVQQSTDRGVDSVVYTNGNILSPRRIRKTVEASPLLVRVSLNAGTEAVYNQFHQAINPSAFQRTLRSIDEFSKGARQNPRLSLGVGVVVNEVNQDDLVETALRLREIADKGGKIDFVTYRPEFNYYGKDQLSPELLDKTFSIVEEEVRRLLEPDIAVSNVRVRYEALKKDTRNYQECRAAGLCAEIAPSGVYFCCDRNLNRKYLIGSLDEQNVGQITFGGERQRIWAYVENQKCGVCPPACKSHETNIQFQQVEDLRARGEIYKVKAWISELRKMPKPKMVNFP